MFFFFRSIGAVSHLIFVIIINIIIKIFGIIIIRILSFFSFFYQHMGGNNVIFPSSYHMPVTFPMINKNSQCLQGGVHQISSRATEIWLVEMISNNKVLGPCGSYRVFIKYCVFSEFFQLFRTLAFLCFPSVSVCVHTPGR